MKIKNILPIISSGCILATIPLAACSVQQEQPDEKDYFEGSIDSGVYEPQTTPCPSTTYESVEDGTKAYLEAINTNKNIFYDDIFLGGRKVFSEESGIQEATGVNYLKIQLNSVNTDECRISYEITVHCKKVPAQDCLMDMHINYSNFLFKTESYIDEEQKTKTGLVPFFGDIDGADALLSDDKWNLDYEIDFYRPSSYDLHIEEQINTKKIKESENPYEPLSKIATDIVDNRGANGALTFDSNYFSKVTVNDGE